MCNARRIDVMHCAPAPRGGGVVELLACRAAARKLMICGIPFYIRARAAIVCVLFG